MSVLDLYLKGTQAYKDFDKSCRILAGNLEGFPLLCFALLAAEKTKSRIWLICPTEEKASQLVLNTTEGFNIPVFHIPSTGRVIYSSWQGSEKEYTQLRALINIQNSDSCVIVTNLRAFCLPLPDAIAVQKQILKIRCNDNFEINTITQLLAKGNYYRSDRTSMPGEFSMRGEVLDIFPYGAGMPVRIYLDWDKVEKICLFDSLSQRIVKQISHIEIEIVNSDGMNLVAGSVSSYIRNTDFFIFCGDKLIENSFNSLNLEAQAMYRKLFRELRENNSAQVSESLISDNEKNSLKFYKKNNITKPSDIIFDFKTFMQSFENTMTLCDIQSRDKKICNFDIEGPRSFFGNFTIIKNDLKGLESDGWDINIYVTTDTQKKRLEQMLCEFKTVKYHVLNLCGGFSLPSEHFIAITEAEIFGRKKQIVKTLQHTSSSVIDSFVELNPGDYVVHVNYGIGIFLKIDRVRERDYIKIQFADKENLYVPIEQANLVQRYIGSCSETPHLDKLGSGGWESKKAKARKSAESLARKLIEIYARRQNSSGYPFAKDNDWQLKFEAEFEFEETDDQLTCIQDVKEDMESNKVMDRLICGDVGYGKTEIAFRAAFKAVMSGKQVSFLAPTTILARQHYDNFCERLKSFPLKCAILSRMVGRKEQKQVISDLKEGKIDVLFGTHRIIQKDIIFKDLGLLVVDEEQRFGVKDKEKIKEIKSNVDCLCMSATPIPRTLYMSLLKIRDISLLTTAPIIRKPIKTIIKNFDPVLIEKAIRFEISRGGQVFYLHNRIETLENIADMIRKMVPEAVVETANGQMDSNYLEDTMRRFVYEGIQVLVSTTIIENGIDIPNVNTIIIDRADMFGVSQLYQLKGRVGRSDREAFAYLFYPSDAVLSTQAVKRLKIISEHTQLGSGFKIAMKDMELRGAGNLLGKEQSGFMSSVGLDMYIRLLDEQIANLTDDKSFNNNEVFLELQYSGFIPESYIENPSIKLEFYKKLATIVTIEQLESLHAEMEDRFGSVPEEVQNLLYICQLKIICKKLEIYHMKERDGIVTVEFSHVALIPVERLLEIIRTSNGSVFLDPHKPNVIQIKNQFVNLKDKALFILEKLERLLKK